MLLGLVLAATAAASRDGSQRSITFSPPVSLGEVHWGVPYTVPVTNTGIFAVVLAANRTLLSKDGGASYQTAPKATATLGSNVVMASPPAASQPAVWKDFGNASAHSDPGPSGTKLIRSPYADYWSIAEDGQLVSTAKDTPTIFEGFPTPVHCDPDYGACPIRLQGSGTVRFGDGSMLQSAIVYYDGHSGSPEATSIVVFHSSDNSTWTYRGTIANASDYPWSQEGPNEHDLVMLNFGIVLAVVRTDAGDGKPGHIFNPYSYTYSLDGGVTWTKLNTMPGIGCARPRLLMLGDGLAPLLMSGGRNATAINDLKLWIEWTGFGGSYPPKEPIWEAQSLTYWHNALAGDGIPKFTSDVNSTSKTKQTSAYTSLVQTGTCSAVVLYDLVQANVHHGFSMKVNLRSDQGECSTAN